MNNIKLLSLSLLGEPLLFIDGTRTTIERKKSLALLLYLITEDTRQRGKELRRTDLANLIWDNVITPEKRRNNLTKAISGLGTWRVFIDGTNSQLPIALLRPQETEIQVDIDLLCGLEQRKKYTLFELDQFEKQYRGSFLQNFTVESENFMAWIDWQKRRFCDGKLRVCNTLIWHYANNRGAVQSLDIINKFLNIYPFDENAIRTKLILLSLQQQRATLEVFWDEYLAYLDDEEIPRETGNLYRKLLTEVFHEGKNALPLLDVQLAMRDTLRSSAVEVFASRKHIVGRHDIINHLLRNLTDQMSNNRICLVGMGGIGKSTLAKHLGYLTSDHFTDGVLWGDFAHIPKSSIITIWLRNCGIVVLPDMDDGLRVKRLQETIAARKYLIVFDGVRESHTIADLLPVVGNSKALITTRDERLARNTRAEVVQIPLLSVEEGIELVNHILLEQPNPVSLERADAQSLVTLLQNLPLAIEIAAKLLKQRSQDAAYDFIAYLNEIENRLAALTDRDDKNEVRAAFEVSWQFLSGNLKSTYASLAVFKEYIFETEAVEFISSTVSNFIKYHTQTYLAGLADLSLLYKENKTYWLHSLLADFVQEKLSDVGLFSVAFAEELHHAMVTYYATYVRNSSHDVMHIERQWGLISHALHTANARDYPNLIVDMVRNLKPYFKLRGNFTDARQYIQWVVDIAEKSNDPELKLEMQCLLSEMCIEQNDLAQARSFLAEALRVGLDLEEGYWLAETQYLIGRVYFEQANQSEDYRQATSFLNNSYLIFEHLGEILGKAKTLYVQADIAYFTFKGQVHDEQSPLTLCEKGIELLASTEPSPDLIRLLVMRSDIAIAREENFQLAIDICQEALDICDALNEVPEKGAVLYSWSEALRLEAKKTQNRTLLDEAHQRVLDSISIFSNPNLNDRKSLARAYHRLARINAQAGDRESAISNAEEAMAIQYELNDYRSLVFTLTIIGDQYRESNDYENACTYWLKARNLITDEHPYLQRLNERITEHKCS